jgi:hypothetical protein
MNFKILIKSAHLKIFFFTMFGNIIVNIKIILGSSLRVEKSLDNKGFEPKILLLCQSAHGHLVIMKEFCCGFKILSSV